MSAPRLQGCIPIVVTPFLPDFSIDEQGLRAQVEWLIAQGVHGLATPAIASEGYKLDDAERDRVAAVVVEQCAGRMPVVVSADGNGADVAVRRAIRAQQLGASALMVLPPMFIKPDAAGLTRYYTRIAAAVELPIMVQDAPQLTGVTMAAQWLAGLHAACPSIASVKIEGTPAGEKTSQVIDLSAGGMDVFAGWGGLSFLEGLQRGARGCMPAPNFGPPLAHVYDLYAAGEPEEARSLFVLHAPFIAWSMQSVELSIWCAKQTFVQLGLLRHAVLREPATLPDAILRTEFERYLAV